MKKRELIERIKKREAKIAVIGLGRVGLPTAVIFANVGFRVIGVDVSRKIIATISKGKSPYAEPNLDNLLKKAIKMGKLKTTTNTTGAAKEADVAVVCVQTPLTEDKKPNLSYLEAACEDVAEGLSSGKLVAIESTVPPRTTKELIAPLLEKKSGLKCKTDFWLAYCPERIAPGKAIQEFVENPRIVGGHDKESAEIAAELFRTVVKGGVLVTDCVNAEVAKLAENTFRDVNIAFANELALICEHLGADVTEVIKLANTHPRVNVHRPGCGVGGPCLPKDPYLLLHGVKTARFRSKVIGPSRELNDLMPEHTIELVVKALKKAGKDIKKSKIAVLGVAYKEDVNDVTNSPAERIIKRLRSLGAKVFVFDPYCEESFGARKATNIWGAVKDAECMIICTGHKILRELKIDKLKIFMGNNPVIIGGERIINPVKWKEKGI
ncbi:UDP-N-acetyl-D-mannosamine dehydrogenase [subsurface metagenome]